MQKVAQFQGNKEPLLTLLLLLLWSITIDFILNYEQLQFLLLPLLMTLCLSTRIFCSLFWMDYYLDERANNEANGLFIVDSTSHKNANRISYSAIDSRTFACHSICIQNQKLHKNRTTETIMCNKLNAFVSVRCCFCPSSLPPTSLHWTHFF